MIPFLTYAQNRDLREKLYKGYYMRGNNDNANDNKAVLAKMVNLRTEKAKLLGFDTYASLRGRCEHGQNPEGYL